MKHELRADKTCLNCGTEVPGRFCTECGQENREPRETFLELTHHFFADITHYDSKFFKSIKDLLLKPGFLTREYIAGRRAAYLNPVRMYVFISFVFFLVIFAFSSDFNVNTPDVPGGRNPVNTANAGRLITDSLIHKNDLDSATGLQLRSTIDSTIVAEKQAGEDMTRFNSVKAFDSAQAALPPARRMTGVLRYIVRKKISWNEKYGNRTREVIIEKIEHNIPKMMFVLLPFFALLLRMFYNGKKYFYADHIIFSLHIHSFIFLLLLVSLALDHFLHTHFFGFSFLLTFVYFIFALKKAYKERFIFSFLKGTAIVSIYFLVEIFCFAAMTLLTMAMV